MKVNFWDKKRVLVTGHTGFKGSWLTLWLDFLGCDVFGVSDQSKGINSIYEQAKLYNVVQNNRLGFSEFINILDQGSLKKTFETFEPEIIFHLAAQPLVIESYKDPRLTYETNVMGTVNVLEAGKKVESIKAILSVTTDKVYENSGQIWGYRETDRLGGFDPYSSSKACADIVTQSYFSSFYRDLGIGIAPTRAGNVIGGGDWSEYRLIPDIYKSIRQNEPLQLRFPNAVRPWQHVLEPLYGYIQLAEKLVTEPAKFSRPFNFGPKLEDTLSVTQVCEIMSAALDTELKLKKVDQVIFHEADLLKLDSTLARNLLGWSQKLTSEAAVKLTVDWHKNVLDRDLARQTTLKQIEEYISL